MDKFRNLTVCGFGPFEGVDVNPAESLVHKIAGDPAFRQRFVLSTHVFPVIYDNALNRIEAVVNNTKPDILLIMGVNQLADSLRLEKYAKNFDCTETPDNQGTVRIDQAILSQDAPQSFATDLPLEIIIEDLNVNQPIAQISEDAGGYICNHYYYLANWALKTRKSPCKCLFIHIPMLPHIFRDVEISLDVAAASILKIANCIADVAALQTA